MARYESMLALRYLGITRRHGFVSFVAGVSIVGLALGVAVLIIVLSVLNGFERELRQRLLAVTAHATVRSEERLLGDWQSLQALALADKDVQLAAPFIEQQAMLSAGGRTLALNLRGVRVADELARGADSLLAAPRLQSGPAGGAALASGPYRLYLGAQLARELAVKAGDSVIAIAPQATATPAGLAPRMRRFVVAGTFASGMYEYDRGLALAEMQDAARFFQMGDAVTGVRLSLHDPQRAPALVRALARRMVDRDGRTLIVSDWTQSHANFFRSIQLTKSMLFIILLLIVAVAAFNLVASLVMIVRDKQGDIAILRTLGAGPGNVLLSFVMSGALIGGLGIAGGALLGVIGAWNTETVVRWLGRLNGAPLLDAEVYLMSDLPADVQWPDVVKVCGAALVLCTVATLYPAWKAARTVPAEVLRHD
jgi:lipoprotein-releasing system permease protein